jgi:hypothetical protein
MYKCQSIASALRDTLLADTRFHQTSGACIITLPIPTVDGRLVDVFVEQRMSDYCVVHDGGKAAGELTLQGVKLTESIDSHFQILAKRFGISYVNETFSATGKAVNAHTMALSVGMCSGVAMAQLVGHIATLVDEPLRHQVGSVVRGWAKKNFKISPDITVPGGHAKHRFDFVAFPKKRAASTVAMSVLLPGSNSLAAAERFGFKTTDLEATDFAKWRKVVVQGRSEAWSSEAKAILTRCADAVIELREDQKLDAGELRDRLDQVAA